jgi:hypothetical protein
MQEKEASIFRSDIHDNFLLQSLKEKQVKNDFCSLNTQIKEASLVTSIGKAWKENRLGAIMVASFRSYERTP